MLTAKCPKGHDVLFDEPAKGKQLVGVTEDGEEVTGVVVPDEMVVKCPEPVDAKDPKKGLCGAVFVVDLTAKE